MKKLGLVGGLGPASTVDYYKGYIERVRRACGEDVYPEFVIDNVNMHAVISGIARGAYEATANLLLHSLACLRAAGADFAAITANTPHIVWPQMENRLPLPTVSIVDSAVAEMRRRNCRRVLVLGTVFTMESGLYAQPMQACGIVPVIPDAADRATIGRLIYPNLENGIIIPADRERMIALAEQYIVAGNADAALLGCTEIPLVIGEGDLSVPVLDTTQIHLDELFRRAADGT